MLKVALSAKVTVEFAEESLWPAKVHFTFARPNEQNAEHTQVTPCQATEKASKKAPSTNGAFLIHSGRKST
ncbi:hypothetical protein GH754_05165 [Salinibacillus xinjiangensis]|uniref:Uncharacterized protein n=1 Tax=Salinibacillus xinjiangensis TaxID=1229268 RepID=A0A6G1X437_9BACI|nr:hypothetical protein [Salinibacillus xinjiangensis]